MLSPCPLSLSFLFLLISSLLGPLESLPSSHHPPPFLYPPLSPGSPLLSEGTAGVLESYMQESRPSPRRAALPSVIGQYRPVLCRSQRVPELQHPKRRGGRSKEERVWAALGQVACYAGFSNGAAGSSRVGDQRWVYIVDGDNSGNNPERRYWGGRSLSHLRRMSTS
ncbi:hypothetical protein M430DRAFT_31024 [Amorphotheca resinae ATCC 22711]|uniref:Uncharacterized protein n=1 Tax=Amorphotheca resinae ATCC 22711 TaxID=857342 RepID=A0A2T3ARY4_AMORE|nr:hypothetical protein M430DRAFT_31024 [Amorphotheca resinae ATCC 22711]PSS09139.1 hypothetical protein M430DRAFT_31024 [Amorphotheca resinae ATCC 22711]